MQDEFSQQQKPLGNNQNNTNQNEQRNFVRNPANQSRVPENRQQKPINRDYRNYAKFRNQKYYTNNYFCDHCKKYGHTTEYCRAKDREFNLNNNRNLNNPPTQFNTFNRFNRGGFNQQNQNNARFPGNNFNEHKKNLNWNNARRGDTSTSNMMQTRQNAAKYKPD